MGTNSSTVRGSRWDGAKERDRRAALLLPHSPLRLKSRTVEDAKFEPIQSLAGIDGALGVAYTDLRPGGTALINDQKVDVVAESCSESA